MGIVTHLLPRSVATNSYQLMDDACTVIEQEPKRFFWGDWVRPAWNRAEDERPACNTLGCLHGWLSILSKNTDVTVDVDALSNLFPLRDHQQMADDFENLAYGRGGFHGIAPDAVLTPQQREEILDEPIQKRYFETQEAYAARGVRALRQFMAKWESELRAHAIPLPPVQGRPIVKDWAANA